MKIVVFGGSGHIGGNVVKEAKSRGHEVVAVVRDPAKAPAGGPYVKGDATDAASVASVVRGADAVVNAISPRPSAAGAAPSLVDSAKAMIAGLEKAGVKRLLVVGGAGSLEVAPGLQLLDAPGFPDMYQAEAEAGRASFKVYREQGGALDWTYFSPAAIIQPGQRTGKFRLGGDQLVADGQGNSTISYEDYAVALVDELEQRRHVKKRFTIGY